jgi:hypothetical protein
MAILSASTPESGWVAFDQGFHRAANPFSPQADFKRWNNWDIGWELGKWLAD